MQAIGRVIDHGQFILGPEVDEFESHMASYVGTRNAISVNSGTDALLLAVRALGIGPNTEVITVPNSFVATTSVIAMVGAKPVLVDVGDDYNIDPTKLAAAVTPRTRAILPVHLTGRPADMDAIKEVADRYRLAVIEDAAQAVGAEYRKRRVGSLGTIGCFSLHPLKTLNACGDGGLITTDDDQLADQFRVLRNVGLRSRDNCEIWSGNSRLDTLQAAVLLVKLRHLDEWTERRRENAALYRSLLAECADVRVPHDRPFERSVYHTFTIVAERRDALKRHLANRGVGTAIHYPVPIHLHQAARSLGYSRGAFPVAEYQADHILSLPVYPELDASAIEYVAKAIVEFYS